MASNKSSARDLKRSEIKQSDWILSETFYSFFFSSTTSGWVAGAPFRTRDKFCITRAKYFLMRSCLRRPGNKDPTRTETKRQNFHQNVKSNVNVETRSPLQTTKTEWMQSSLTCCFISPPQRDVNVLSSSSPRSLIRHPQLLSIPSLSNQLFSHYPTISCFSDSLLFSLAGTRKGNIHMLKLSKSK